VELATHRLTEGFCVTSGTGWERPMTKRMIPGSENLQRRVQKPANLDPGLPRLSLHVSALTARPDKFMPRYVTAEDSASRNRAALAQINSY
jgi:hypothetical protein